MQLLKTILCWAGFHKWREYEFDFFNPRNVMEECLNCKIKRRRFDKRAYRRSMWK